MSVLDQNFFIWGAEWHHWSANVRGKLGKALLDPVRITFKLYPREGCKETKKSAWGTCVIAIDEVNQRSKNNVLLQCLC